MRKHIPAKAPLDTKSLRLEVFGALLRDPRSLLFDRKAKSRAVALAREPLPAVQKRRRGTLCLIQVHSLVIIGIHYNK